MEALAVVPTLRYVSLAVDKDGIIRPPNNPTAYYGWLDGNVLCLGCNTRIKKIDRIPIDDIKGFTTADANSVLGIYFNDETLDYVGITQGTPDTGHQSTSMYQNIIDLALKLDITKKFPKNLMNYRTILLALMPDIVNKVYYDVNMECIVCDMSIFGHPELGVVRYIDEYRPFYYLAIDKLFEEAGLDVSFPNTVRDDGIALIAQENRRNPFLEWLQSLTWDGQDRVSTMFSDLFGAVVPNLPERDGERYLSAVARAWLAGAVYRAHKTTKHEVVPVMLSKQGMGKGSALELLAGKDEWFKDTVTSPVDKPEKFISEIRGRIIVELSESTQLKKDVEALKGFISISEDQCRKAYAHIESVYPRRFIMVATSNGTAVFTDVTGNRRFYPIFIDSYRARIPFSPDRSIGQDYVEQIWAQVYDEYLKGTLKTYVPYTVDMMAETVRVAATMEHAGILAINTFLDEDNEYSRIGARISRQIIMREVFGYSPKDVPSKEAESAWRAWSAAGSTGWKLATSTIMVEGKPSRGFIREYEPGVMPIKETLLMVDKAPLELVEAFADHVRDCPIDSEINFHNFVARGMSRYEAIDSLLDAGYITEEMKGGKKVYTLRVRP